MGVGGCPSPSTAHGSKAESGLPPKWCKENTRGSNNDWQDRGRNGGPPELRTQKICPKVALSLPLLTSP